MSDKRCSYVEVIKIFDLTANGVYTHDGDYPVCPGCSYRASIFATAEEDITFNFLLPYFQNDELDQVPQPPLCQTCWFEIFQEYPDICYKFEKQVL